MSKAVIKDIRSKLPKFEEFNIYGVYGISRKCCIEGKNIVKPYEFHAICGWLDKYFEYSPSGYEEAIKWLEEKRILCMKYLGVEVDNE